MGDSLKAGEVVCEVCKKAWPADQSMCPDDGSWLHEETIMELGKLKRAPSIGDDEFPPETTDRARRPYAPTAPPPIAGKPIEIGPGFRVGDYEIEELIGEGAMGKVYKAIHPAIGKRVAIKVMTPKVFDEPESVKRFVAEARAVAAIEHRGIVDIFGFGRLADSRTYLVMEWLEGKSLAARLLEGPLPFEDACDIIRQIARALEAAHGKGIVHRDMKPENVFLKKSADEEKPLVKLLDFGLAKQTNKEDQLVARTRTGQMLGTPLYMSPEQCKSKGVDHRTDIYALGCMCYELLCGRVPFDCDNIAELISAHLVGEPPQPSSIKPDISPELDKLLFGMVQKDPDKRPPLGEIRRIIGMSLSRPTGPMAHVSPDEFTPPPGSLPTAAALFGVPLVQQSTSNSALSTTSNILRQSRKVYIVGALVIVAVVIALIAALR